MSTQTYLTLGSTLYDIENVEEMKIVQKPNEHGILYLTAIVKESKKDEYLNTIGTIDNIEIGYYTLVEDKEEKVTLFKGIVTTPDSEVINGKNAIKIIAKTGSYAMDIKRNFRSFQNKNAMYGDIYKEVFASYGGHFIYDRKNDCKTDRFILQHNETDWEFLKRVASMYNIG